MSAPEIDPVLACLEYLEEYRRSWRCWLLGGPAALDEMAVSHGERGSAIRLRVELQFEKVHSAWKRVTPDVADRMRWEESAEPTPPPEGTFVDAEQRFALAASRVTGACAFCFGTGMRRCPTCGGSTRHEEASFHQTPPVSTMGLPTGVICPRCRGCGKVPCACPKDAPVAEEIRMVSYEEVCHTYQHRSHTLDLLPADAPQDGLPRRLRRAWGSAHEHVLIRTGSFTELIQRVRATPGTGETLALRVADLCDRILQWMEKGHRPEVVGQSVSPPPSARGTTRTLFFRVEARAAGVVSAAVRQGSTVARFSAVGTGEASRRRLVGFRRGPIVSGIMTPVFCLVAASIWLLAFSDSPGVGRGMWLYWIYILMGKREGRRDIMASWSALTRFPRLLARCRHPAPPTLVVLSPDARASALLVSLFAHLAAFAHLHDPRRGGTVLDDTHPDLTEALHAADAETPQWSATCRMECGAGAPGARRARVVHLVLPEGGLGRAHRRTLACAAQVWCVLPQASTDTARDGMMGEVLACAPDARITLLCDGADATAGLDAWPAVRAALAGRPHDCQAADLAGLRDRYLAGRVSPEEAGGMVAWLSGVAADVPAVWPNSTSAGAPAPNPAGAAVDVPNARLAGAAAEVPATWLASAATETPAACPAGTATTAPAAHPAGAAVEVSNARLAGAALEVPAAHPAGAAWGGAGAGRAGGGGHRRGAHPAGGARAARAAGRVGAATEAPAIDPAGAPTAAPAARPAGTATNTPAARPAGAATNTPAARLHGAATRVRAASPPGAAADVPAARPGAAAAGGAAPAPAAGGAGRAAGRAAGGGGGPTAAPGVRGRAWRRAAALIEPPANDPAEPEASSRPLPRERRSA